MITACITFRASHLCILSVKKKKKTLLGEEVKKESETKLFSHVKMKIALESDFSWRLIGSSVLLCVSASICVCVAAGLHCTVHVSDWSASSSSLEDDQLGRDRVRRGTKANIQ